MSSQATPRLLIIGLDGADWTLLRPLLDDGAMPALRSLIETGVTATLESVLPTNSMSAWTSLMTGVNPGKHGLYDFFRKTSTPFETHPTNSTQIRFPTIWETLSAYGLRSCVIDMPPTYPPFAINGVMVGGMGAGVSADSSYVSPPELQELIEREAGGFVLDRGWVDRSGREAQIIEELVAAAENRGRIAELMLDQGAFDVFSIVFVQTDRVQHVLWQDLLNHGPNYAQARRVFEAIDTTIARLIDRIDRTATEILIVSDHGFRSSRKVVDMNQALLKLGLGGARWVLPPGTRLAQRALRLPLPSALRNRLQTFVRNGWVKRRWVFPAESLAYSDLAESVNVNLQGRESSGSVPLSRFEETRDRVAAGLLDFRDPRSNESVIRRIVSRDDYFHGEYATEAPDMVLEASDGYGLSSKQGALVWEWPECQGLHSRAGIIAATGPGFRSGESVSTLSILDVAPTVLALLGVPSPAGVDGRIAQELLGRPLEPASGAATEARRAAAPAGYSEAEEALVRERLKNLGYLE